MLVAGDARDTALRRAHATPRRRALLGRTHVASATLKQLLNCSAITHLA